MTFTELLPKQSGYVKTSEFLPEVVDILLDYVRKSNDRSCKVNISIMVWHNSDVTSNGTSNNR